MIVTDESVCFWVAERTGGEYVIGTGQGIGLVRGGELVAGASYDNFNGRSVHVSLAAVPGKRWMNREYLWFNCYYMFEQLKVIKAIGFVDSTNTEAIEFDLHFGFEHEATLTDAGPKGDLLILTLTKENCRFLTRGKRNGRKIFNTCST
jgi:RimJ/RimL family protein N-acetyltransferase